MKTDPLEYIRKHLPLGTVALYVVERVSGVPTSTIIKIRDRHSNNPSHQNVMKLYRYCLKHKRKPEKGENQQEGTAT